MAMAVVLSDSNVGAQTLINLGDLGGGNTFALSINNLGMIVGSSNASNGKETAFLYTSGSGIQSLGILAGYTSSYAQSINDLGQIAGGLSTSSASTNFFYSSATGMQNIGALSGNARGFPRAINNSGQIVGEASANSSGTTVAYLYSSSTGMQNIGTLPGLNSATAYDINNSGQVVGRAYSLSGNGGNDTAFLYSTSTGMTSLGTLSGYTRSYASSINNLGQVVGVASTLSTSTIFIYSGGSMNDIGNFGGYSTEPTSINDSGVVVGYFVFPTYASDAFIYSASNGMQDLNSIYSTLLVSGTGAQVGFTNLNIATDINNLGQIIGVGSYWNGSSLTDQSFLLSPVSVPEPSTWALLMGGISLLLVFRPLRSRKNISCYS